MADERVCERCRHEGPAAEVGRFLKGGTARPQELCHDSEACAERQRWVTPLKPPTEERQHYMTCRDCGQDFDKRDLAWVLAHEVPGHGPVAPADLPIIGSLGVPLPRTTGPGEGS